MASPGLENSIGSAASQKEKLNEWQTTNKQAQKKDKRTNASSTDSATDTDERSSVSSTKLKRRRRRKRRKKESGNVLVDFIKYLLIGSPFFRCTESDDGDDGEDTKQPSIETIDVEKTLAASNQKETPSVDSKAEKIKKRGKLRAKLRKKFIDKGKNVTTNTKQAIINMKNHLTDNVLDVVDEGYEYDRGVIDWKKFTRHRYNRGIVSQSKIL